MATDYARFTLLLEPATLDDLDYICRRTSRSRSQVVRELLASPLRDLASIMRSVPPEPTLQDLLDAQKRGLDLFDQRALSERAKLASPGVR